MSVVCVAALDRLDDGIVEAVEGCLRRQWGVETRRLAALGDPEYAWDAARRQYGSVPILLRLAAGHPQESGKLLALTNRDLFIPMLSFIYGQAQLGGRIALVSLARLRQEFYGLPPNAGLLAARAEKECLHEAGHAFGLVHCSDKSCAMSLSTNIRQIDLKNAALCSACAAATREYAK